MDVIQLPPAIQLGRLDVDINQCYINAHSDPVWKAGRRRDSIAPSEVNADTGVPTHTGRLEELLDLHAAVDQSIRQELELGQAESAGMAVPSEDTWNGPDIGFSVHTPPYHVGGQPAMSHVAMDRGGSQVDHMRRQIYGAHPSCRP